LRAMLGKKYYGLIVVNERKILMKLVPVERLDAIVKASNSYKPCQAWTGFFNADDVGDAPNSLRESYKHIKRQENHEYRG